MDNTRLWDEVRSLKRGQQELRSEVARIPVENGKTRGFTGRMIRAQVNGAVASSDPTGAWDNPIEILPSTGWTAPTSGTFDNSIYQQEFLDGDIVFLWWNPDAEAWEPERGGSAGSIVVSYELTQDKGYADVAKLAKPIDDTGAIISAADAFYVVDNRGQFYGKAAAGAEIGFQGIGLKISDAYSGADGTKPAYRIIAMEGPATFLVGATTGAYSGGGTPFSTHTPDLYYGKPFNNRRVPATGSVSVFDDLDVAANIKVGERWIVKWNETDARYDFWLPLDKYITIKGTSPGVTRATSTFTLGSPVSVNGRVPPGTITVTNDPPLNSPAGRTIYARFNITRGSTLITAWDTGDAGNFLELLRGLADYNAGTGGIPQLIDHDATGDSDPHWHDAGPCETP
jgi:hypothetical protein